MKLATERSQWLPNRGTVIQCEIETEVLLLFVETDLVGTRYH